MTYRYILIFYVLNMCFKQIITLTVLIMDFLWCIWKEDMQKNGKMKDCVVLILIFMKGGVCSSHSRIFHSFGAVTIIGEGLQI